MHPSGEVEKLFPMAAAGDDIEDFPDYDGELDCEDDPSGSRHVSAQELGGSGHVMKPKIAVREQRGRQSSCLPGPGAGRRGGVHDDRP